MSAKNSPQSAANPHALAHSPAPERLPPIPDAALTAEQKSAVAEFSAGRGYPPLGPFCVMLRSPEVMLRAKAMGDYLRYRNRLPKDISEMVILQTARGWSQSFEFVHHAKFALEAGLPQAVVDAIAEGRRPNGLNPAQTAAYDFTAELQTNKRVSDTTYAHAISTFGEPGVIDLTGVQGYYTFLAMMMNVARTPAPADGHTLTRWPE